MSEYRKNISKDDPNAIKVIDKEKSRPIWIYSDELENYLNMGYILSTGSLELK